MTVDQRRALGFMRPGRADVIGAGALILSRILARTTVPELVASESDILARHRLVDGAVDLVGSGHRVRGELPQPGHPRGVREPGPLRARWPIDPTNGWRPELGRLERRHLGMPDLSAAGRVARDGRGREADVVRRRALLGAPIAGWGSDDAQGAHRRLGAGGEWWQPDRPDLHRRPIGDWLFAALHRAAWPRSRPASMPATAALLHSRMVAAVRCAPPLNKPTIEERDACAGWLRHGARVGQSLRSSSRWVASGGTPR